MEGIGTPECPVSLISAESIALLGEFHSARAARKETGAVYRGEDSGKWPAYWFDAVVTLTDAQVEADAIETAE